MTADQFVEALRTVELTGRAIAPFFEQYDVLITPTIAATVPPLGLLDTSRPQSMFENAARFASYTSPFNITGQPAMSMPLAHDETGLPVGVQFVAAAGREDCCSGSPASSNSGTLAADGAEGQRLSR